MECRYHLSNGRFFIQHSLTIEGHEFLENYRSTHPAYKHKKIISGIQAYPSKVELGKEYRIS